MKFKLEQFLKITAVLASAGAMAAGCTVNQDVDGNGGSAGAGASCLGDTGSNPDAGTESGICGALGYALTTCGADDAGTEGAPPDGYLLCNYMEVHGRPGVTEEMFNCLNALPASTACDASHTTGVNACITTVFSMACGVGPVTVGSETVSCKDVEGTCPAVSGGTVGITEAECQASINSMDATTRVNIMQCYNDAAPATGDCADDFTECVFNIDAYP
ncbi:MAG: hypothetical protein R3B13_07675 [Polyangiaceae bacterium]